MLWALLLALAAASHASVNSSIQLSNQPQNNQQPLTSLRNSFREIPLNVDYFMLPGDDQLMSLSQHSKRARKMSAFMPMRGRKDGRETTRSRLTPQSELSNTNYGTGNLPAEANGPIEEKIKRLIGALLANGAVNRPKLNSRWSFIRANTNRPAMEQLYEGDLKSEQLASFSPEPLQVESPENSLLATKENSLARFQRAFAPMRGKKSDLHSIGLDEDIVLEM